MTTHLYVPAFTLTDEIPQGLQLIANAVGHTLSLNGERSVRKEVLISSIFRLIVGYLFLSSLFINIAQNDDVIEIFYDGECIQMKVHVMIGVLHSDKTVYSYHIYSPCT